jgi:predicted nucleic acid-binding protein
MEGKEIMLPYVDFNFYISIITEIEVRSKKSITPTEDLQIQEVLKDCIISGIDPGTKEISIAIRKMYGLKLSDSLIAASAWHQRLPIVTADKAFARIIELDVILIEF